MKAIISTAVIVAFLSMTLVACNKQTAEQPAISAPISASDAMESKAKAAILAALKDPDSAQFKDLFCLDYECTAMVNAKNSMGGYTGFTKMYYNDHTGAVKDYGH
jgi:hypothetical protein